MDTEKNKQNPTASVGERDWFPVDVVSAKSAKWATSWATVVSEEKTAETGQNFRGCPPTNNNRV